MNPSERRTPSKLETLTGAALMSMPLPATRMIVESLVPQGLHILGGAPKIGKSWLTLWLCLRIAKANPCGTYRQREATRSTSAWRTASPASRTAY